MKKGLCLFVFVSALALILATSQTTSPSSSTNPHNNFLSDQNSGSTSGQAGATTSGGGVAGQTTGNGSSNRSGKPGGTTETPTEQTPPPENAAPSSQLQPQIQNALKNEPTLASDNLNVTVSDDEIDLAGSVATAKEKLTAKRIVQSFAGNRKVKDQLTLAGRNPQ